MVKKVKFRFSNDRNVYDLNMSIPDFKKIDENVSDVHGEYRGTYIILSKNEYEKILN